MLKMSEKRNRQRSEKQQRAQSQPTKKRRELPVAYSGVSTVSGVNEFERGLYDTRVRIRARRRDLSLQVLYKFSENMIKPNPNSKSEVYKKYTKSSRKFPLGGNKHKTRSSFYQRGCSIFSAGNQHDIVQVQTDNCTGLVI
jgi:hypothetical protein